MFEELFQKRGLSFDRLRTFLAIAEADGSIAKAAGDNLVRQSQFSRQLRELEEFFGVELAARRGKSLSLTPAGKSLAARIRAQFEDFDDFCCEQKKVPKTFVFGAGASVIDWVLLPAICGIKSALGDSVIQLETHRSLALVEAVKDGRLDFAIVREDALPEKSNRVPLVKVRFFLCVPRRLLPRGKPDSAIDHSKFWHTLPFAAGKDGGQLDQTIRHVMREAGVKFRPAVECSSMLQARQFIQRGECAGILPSAGIHGLSADDIVIREFAPLKNYGRHLVLHWNERQMRRRNVDDEVISRIAAAITKLLQPKG